MKTEKKELETFYPSNIGEWRTWLKDNHDLKKSIWVIFYKKKTNVPSISWSEAVDEALCFGWIDSTKKTIDSESYMQYFSRRKPDSIWSKVNKDKIQYLMENDQMTKAGFDSIAIAKENGSWTRMDEVEKLIIPVDLEKEFASRANSKEYFLALSKSKKKELLAWIVLAKRPQTREKRILEIANCAAENKRPKQFVS